MATLFIVSAFTFGLVHLVPMAYAAVLARRLDSVLRSIENHEDALTDSGPVRVRCLDLASAEKTAAEICERLAEMAGSFSLFPGLTRGRFRSEARKHRERAGRATLG